MATPERHNFETALLRWTRRDARAATSVTDGGKRGPPSDGANGDLLLGLPAEVILLVCASPAITSRELLALELTCSRFRLGSPSLAEQAAKARLIAAGAMPVSVGRAGTGVNFKSLLHHVLENAALPVGGFQCAGRRPPRLVREWEPTESYTDPSLEDGYCLPEVPVPTGCGCDLMWNPVTQRLFCPAGCGCLVAPTCACKAYERGEKKEAIADEEPLFVVMAYSPDETRKRNPSLRADLEKMRSTPAPPPYPDEEEVSPSLLSYWESLEPIRKQTPSMTCTSCGLTVAGYACLGREGNPYHQPSEPPRHLLQAGFYERVWCSFRWSCSESGCCVVHGGPEERNPQNGWRRDRALLCCASKAKCRTADRQEPGKQGTEMATLTWLDEIGPPTNYYGYRCVGIPKNKEMPPS